MSIVDKVTGNALDKLGNAIKDGDIKEITSLFKGILEGVEDKVGEVGDILEDAIADAKKDIRREVAKVKRRLIRETREEMEQLSEEFGEKMIEAMRGEIKAMVAGEFYRQLQDGPNDWLASTRAPGSVPHDTALPPDRNEP